METITFVDCDGKKESIKITDLAEYPESFLTMMSKRSYGKDFDETTKAFKVPAVNNTLKTIATFYATRVWPNPFDTALRENRLEFDNIEGNFYQMCQFLGLPSSEIADPVKDEDPTPYDDCYEDELNEIDELNREYFTFLEEEQDEYAASKLEARHDRMNGYGDYDNYLF